MLLRRVEKDNRDIVSIAVEIQALCAKGGAYSFSDITSMIAQKLDVLCTQLNPTDRLSKVEVDELAKTHDRVMEIFRFLAKKDNVDNAQILATKLLNLINKIPEKNRRLFFQFFIRHNIFLSTCALEVKNDNLAHQYLTSARNNYKKLEIKGQLDKDEIEQLGPSFRASYYPYMAIIAARRKKYVSMKKYFSKAIYYHSILKKPAYRSEVITQLASLSKLTTTCEEIAMVLVKNENHSDAITLFEKAKELCTTLLNYPIKTLVDGTLKDKDGYEIDVDMSNLNHVQQWKNKPFIFQKFIESERKKLYLEKFNKIKNHIAGVSADLECSFSPENNKLIISTKNIDILKLFNDFAAKDKLKRFAVTNENKFVFNLEHVKTKTIYSLIDRINQTLKSTPAAAKPEPLKITNTAEEKQQKQERHQQNETARQAAPTLPTPVAIIESVVPPTIKTVVWNGTFEPLDTSKKYPPFFRIYGNPNIKTYGFFNQASLETIPDPGTLNKAEQQAKMGTVLASNNNKGRQGFKPLDDKRTKRYKGFSFVLKLIGAHGDHRFPGKVVAEGKVLKNGVDTGKKAQLVEFVYAHKGHKIY